MSRIGRLPIDIPAKVKVEVKDRKVSVEGPKGKLDFELPRRTSAVVAGAQIKVSRDGDDAKARACVIWSSMSSARKARPCNSAFDGTRKTCGNIREELR